MLLRFLENCGSKGRRGDADADRNKRREGTYQIPHEGEVCQAEDSRRRVEPGAVESRHVGDHQVQVDAANRQDEEPSSHLHRPAAKHKDPQTLTIPGTVAVVAATVRPRTADLQSVGEAVHHRRQAGEGQDGNEGKRQLCEEKQQRSERSRCDAELERFWVGLS